MTRSLVCLLALARIAAADAPEPYTMQFGRLDAVQRAATLAAEADAAIARRDLDRGTRALALACYFDALARFDAERAPACQRARAMLRDHPLADAEAAVLGVEGTLFAWRLDIAHAVERLQAAIALGAKLDLDQPAAIPVLRAHFTLGAILAEAGRYDAALAEIGLARSHALTIRAGELVAWTDVWLCRTHHVLGDLERAINHCDAADAYLARDPDRFLEANLRWQQGEVAFGRGHHEVALARYRASYELASARGGELLAAGMKLNIGAALVALGRIDEGRKWFGELEAAVARGELPATYGAQVAEQQGELDVLAGDHAAAARRFEAAATSQFHWLTIRALGRLAATRGKLGDTAGARAAHEEAIRRIETERVGLDGSLPRTLFMALHAAPYRELAAIVARQPGGAARALEIAEAGRARGLLDALAAATSETRVRPSSAAEITSRIGAGHVLVEYVAADTGVFALVVTAGGITAVELPAAGTPAELASRIALFRRRLEAAPDEAAIAPLADALYRDLLAPALAHAPAAGVALIAADGPLHDLPFEAIAPTAIAVARVPSASMLGIRAPSPATGMLVAAPPDTARLGDLHAARDEAELLRERFAGVAVLAGDAATLATIRNHARSVGVFHFAGHAVIDPALPLRSALVLAPAGDHDGWWRATDVYQRPLDVQLVVLSACSTARGQPGGGEGVASLARAFLHAGARATVATLWDVDDAAAARFADELYPRLAAGESIALAMANSRRALRATTPPREWAAFVVTGDPALQVTLLAIEPERASRWWIAVAVAALACWIAGFWLARR